MIDFFHFKGKEAGPKFLVTGGVHGNETCGTIALDRWVDHFQSGQFELLKGELCLIPRVNPKACEQNVRFMEENLNRVFVKSDHPNSYEHEIAQSIMPHIEWADYSLDLHSYTSADVPFAFCDRNDDGLMDFVKIAPVTQIVSHFNDMLEEQKVMSYCSLSAYSLDQGNLALTIECGQHLSKNSPKVAYESVKRYLEHLNMIEHQGVSAYEDKHMIVRSKEIFYKEREGSLTKPWDNFEPIEKGQVLATYDDGEQVIAPYDAVIFLASPSRVGHEWFYLGKIL